MRYLVLLFIKVSQLSAQNNLDELLKANKTEQESLQIKILIENCWLYRNNDPYFAIKCGEEAVKKTIKTGNYNLQSNAKNLLGVVYRNIGDHEKALNLFNEALNLALTIKDSIQIAFSYNNLAGVYRLQGNNPLALEYAFKAFNIFDKFNHKEGEAFCNINIGLIYKNQGDYNKALEFLKNALLLRKEIKDQPGLALTYNLIAEVYALKEYTENAMRCYLSAEKLYKKIGDKRGLAAVWGGIGNIHTMKKNYSGAIEFHSKAIEYSKMLNYWEGQIFNYNKLALIYAKMNHLEDAQKYLLETKKLEGKLKAAYLKLDCYTQWINFYEIINDYKNALFYSKKLSAIKDTLMNQRNLAIVKTLESIFNADKIERENTMLQKDIEMAERQRDYFIVITLLILLIAVITYSRYITKKIANERLKDLNSMKDTLFKIIAHDLRNPFNVLFGYLHLLKDNYDSLNDEERLNYITNMEKAAKQNFHLLENLLLWSRSQRGNIEMEIKVLNLYEILLEIFAVLSSAAMSKKLLLENNIPKNILVMADENMLNTIFRNLIYNGMKFTNEGGKVSVTAYEENKFIKIIVEDNGIGIDENTKSKLFEHDFNKSKNGTAGESGTGLGLIICKDFIEKLGGNIYVESQLNKGTRFIFTLPSHTN